MGPLRMFALLLIHPSTFHFTFERLEIHPWLSIARFATSLD
jgi:hypothetical protein